MAVAVKYRAVRGFKFNGRRFEKGDAIDRAYIVDVAPEKEGTLLRTRFIELPPQNQIRDMDMAGLREFARTVGISGVLPRRKDDLIAEIESEL